MQKTKLANEARWGVKVKAGKEQVKQRQEKLITRLDGELEGVKFLDHQGVLNVLLPLDELLVLHILCHLFYISDSWLLAI
jgi:hypothetical protein